MIRTSRVLLAVIATLALVASPSAGADTARPTVTPPSCPQAVPSSGLVGPSDSRSNAVVRPGAAIIGPVDSRANCAAVVAPIDSRAVIAPLDSQAVIAPIDSQGVIAPLDSQAVIAPLDSGASVTKPGRAHR